MSSDPIIERRLQRERGARKQAEQLLENKSRELYTANLELREMAQNLESLVEERTNELKAARDEAMAANRAKSVFLANISHEIRTPMSSIIGVAELLLESPLSNRDRQHLLLIIDSAKSLLTIINDLLDISKLESGNFQLNKEEFALFDLFDSALDMLGVQANKKHLELCFIPADGLPERVIGDPVRLRQILLNLLGNAIKFTDRGEVKLTASAKDCGQGQVRLRIEVADSGPGIAPEDQSKLFKSFNQIDVSPTRKQQGTGLGLAISKSLVESMGGEIGLQSDRGEGSRFWFTVALEVPEARDTTAQGSARGKNALLLCSNPFLMESLLAMLRSTGAEATATRDLEAFAEVLSETILRGKNIDMVIADLPSMCEAQTVAGFMEALEKHRVMNTVLLTWLNCYECDAQGEWSRVINRPLTRHKLLESILDRRIPPSDLEVKKGVGEEASTRRILLAEDVRPLQIVAKAKLEKRGYTVDIANNGHEALEALRANDYSMIFMDIQMPEVDGITATRKIRSLSDPDKARTPIVALTANAMKGDQEQYLAEGMDDYLGKPIEDQQLDKVLERWTTTAASSE